MLKEKWIKGYELTHSVRSDGKLYRHRKGIVTEIAQCNHSAGYMYSTLTNNKVSKNVLIHRVLAKAFIPHTNDKKYVNHKDGNKKNNELSNLEWVTQSDNIKHSYANGLSKHTKRIGQYTKSGELLNVFDSIIDAQNHCNKPGKTNIACCLRLARCKTAYGYIWRYLNEETEIDESLKLSKV